MITVLAIVAIVAAFGYPRLAAQLQRTRVHQAARVLAADIEVAASLAARDQRPMIFEGVANGYRIRDRTTGAVRFRRTIGPGTEFGVRALHFEPTSVEFFPSGMTSSPMWVRLTNSGYTRQVQLSRAGFVRVTP